MTYTDEEIALIDGVIQSYFAPCSVSQQLREKYWNNLTMLAVWAKIQQSCGFAATDDCGGVRWKVSLERLKIRRERYRVGSNPTTDTK